MRAIIGGLSWAWVFAIALGPCASLAAAGERPELDPEAVERGRLAIVERGFLKAQWSDKAYREAGKFWDEPAPDPDKDPEGYARAFARHYGFSPPVVPNHGLPMGLKRSTMDDGTTRGFQVDCLVCHGGSIGGRGVVGMPNSQIDYETFFFDMYRADDRRAPLLPFILNTTRGTTNAGMMAIVLFSFRNPDLSPRVFPLPMGSNLPELDAPAWWTLKYKDVMYYDGRTPADSWRADMQFLLAEKSLAEFQELEPVFRDVHAYIKSIEPPKYPFPINAEKAERGRRVFKKHCAECHGTYDGGKVEFPGEIVPLDVVGTDPARLEGLSDLAINHFNATWFGEEHPVTLDREGYQAPPLVGIWASAPYLHNGSVPTLATLLNSPTRPKRFTRPPSTDFEHYDQRNVGWKFRELAPDDDPKPKSPHQAHFLFDSSRYGLGNGGHTFGDKLSDDDRFDLIEYLKTL